MSAVIMRVSWNSNYDVALRACLWCAVMLAGFVFAVTIAPVVVGCCTAVVSVAPQILITIAVFAGAWMVKP